MIDSVSDTLDELYTGEKESLEEIRTGQHLDEESSRIVIVSAFQLLLYHAKTITIHRIDCYPSIPQTAIERAFEDIEDEFTLAAASFDPTSTHPERLTAHIAKGTSRILAVLLAHEAEISGFSSGFWTKAKLLATRCKRML